MFREKIIILMFIILILATPVFGSVLEEKTLNEIKIGDVSVDRYQEVCQEYHFEMNSINEKSKAYLQLKIKNYISVSKDLEINITLNNRLIETIKDKDIEKNNIIELKDIRNNNQLSFCVKNDALPRIVIDKESIIGNYYVAQITEDDFYQEVPETGYVNTLIPVKLFIKNSGYDDIEVEVINASSKFLYNSNLENVSGETFYNGVLRAQEMISLDYFVKTDLNISFATPLAKLKYTDRFGKEHIKSVTPKIINISYREHKITAQIDMFKKINPGKRYTGNLIIINETEETLKDLYITHEFLGELKINRNKIIELKPKDVIEVPFTIKTFKEDNYNLSFKINYLSNNTEIITNTEKYQIVSENEDTKQNSAITILIIITIMLFIWIVKI